MAGHGAPHEAFGRNLGLSPAEAEAALADFARTTAMHWREIHFLTSLAEMLHPGLGTEASARVVVERLAGLMRAPSGGVFLRQEEGRLAPVARVGGESAWAAMGLQSLALALASRVVDLGEPVIADGPGDLWAPIGPVRVALPMVGVPVGAQGETEGALVLVGRSGGSSFGTEEARLLSAAATHLGIALRNGRMTHALAEAERISRDLEHARDIQRRLLPSPPYAAAGFDVAAAYHPADRVGGDYFDIVATDDGGFAVCVADVSGHGVPAALFMSGVRSAARALLASAVWPDEVARALNRRVWEDAGDSGVFVTGVIGRWSPASGEMTLVNCGHPSPILVGARGGWRALEEGTLPLGVLHTLDVQATRVRLEPGDALALASDGLLDAADASGQGFGAGRLAAAVASRAAGPLEEAVTGIAGEVRAFTGRWQLDDDLTLLLLRRRAERDVDR